MSMGIGEYLIYSLLGICVVFSALILLMIIIKIMAKFTYNDKKSSKVTEAVSEESVISYAPGSAGEISLYDTDPRTAAMIMAIVADEMNVPVNELRFLSIKEIEQ